MNNQNFVNGYITLLSGFLEGNWKKHEFVRGQPKLRNFVSYPKWNYFHPKIYESWPVVASNCTMSTELCARKLNVFARGTYLSIRIWKLLQVKIMFTKFSPDFLRCKWGGILKESGKLLEVKQGYWKELESKPSKDSRMNCKGRRYNGRNWDWSCRKLESVWKERYWNELRRLHKMSQDVYRWALYALVYRPERYESWPRASRSCPKSTKVFQVSPKFS